MYDAWRHWRFTKTRRVVLTQWRKQHRRGALYGSTQVAKDLVAKDETIFQLRTELCQARSQLKKAEAVIEVQEKVCRQFGISPQD